MISDTWKAPLWTTPKVLRQLEAAAAPRKTIVFGTFSDVPSSESNKSRWIAREALKIADRVFFTGRKAFYIRKMISPKLEGRLFLLDSPEEVARVLAADVVNDELIVVKATSRDHLERIIYAQDAQIDCWTPDCKKLKDCRMCEESGLTGCESNDHS
jgi:UDP-N-acetylmuramoyl-tripeptide--D-alanyl-D-alanine ligase